MPTATYVTRRGQIETYFDRTAADAWKRLTSDAPVSGIRATVRRGRDRMRDTMLSWLPADLSGRRTLDAGCGTGAFSLEMARRGADVVAIDLSGTLVDLARERISVEPECARIDFRVGDMLDASHGQFDHVVAMDSLIHYRMEDAVKAIITIAPRVSNSIVYTFAPATALLSTMHAVGRLIPTGDRAPSIVPTRPSRLMKVIEAAPALKDWRIGRTMRVNSGFYTSQALELVRR
ncbi:MAG: magnesium protoporphyrin IX methyltransferase [Alphaproteobacteria bacterium]